MLARQNAPGIGASGYLPEGGWESNVSFRYQFSDRHFRGREEEKNRQEEDSQVENRVFLYDLGLTYGLTPRTSLSLSVPFMFATRSSLNRDFDERDKRTTTGMGDITLTARHWMLDPEKNQDQNIQLGFGIKLPTGDPNAKVVRRSMDSGGNTVYETRNADQSIQLGDGGFGFLVDVSAFKNIGQFTPYFAATYLFNPQEDSGVFTHRSRPEESIMSIADQYTARAGTLWTPAGSTVSFGLGGRIEGVPVEDQIGGSKGFRRPGYSIGVEPSIGFAAGKSNFSISVPIAVRRARLRSVPDRETPGRHGDAAFADWALLIGWSYRF